MPIMRLRLAVNPAEAQCLIQGFGMSDGFRAGIFFEKAQPDAIRVGMVFLQPASEFHR
jgi:hypothetical protein